MFKLQPDLRADVWLMFSLTRGPKKQARKFHESSLKDGEMSCNPTGGKQLENGWSYTCFHDGMLQHVEGVCWHWCASAFLL